MQLKYTICESNQSCVIASLLSEMKGVIYTNRPVLDRMRINQGFIVELLLQIYNFIIQLFSKLDGVFEINFKIQEKKVSILNQT